MSWSRSYLVLCVRGICQAVLRYGNGEADVPTVSREPGCSG